MKKWGLIFIFVALFFSGCLEDPTTENLDATQLTKEGWEKFESASYQYPIDSDSGFCEAINKFELAVYADPNYWDGYNGLGWSYWRIGLYADAKYNFEIAFSKASGEVKLEIAIGYGSMLLNENNIFDYKKAVTLLEYAIFGANLSDSWHFKHDNSITAPLVHLNLAEAYIYVHRDLDDPDTNNPYLGNEDDAVNAHTAWGQYKKAAELLGADDPKVKELYQILLTLKEDKGV